MSGLITLVLDYNSESGPSSFPAPSSVRCHLASRPVGILTPLDVTPYCVESPPLAAASPTSATTGLHPAVGGTSSSGPSHGSTSAPSAGPPTPGTYKPSIDKWRAMFSSGPPLVHFPVFTSAKSCSLLAKDIGSNKDIWRLCIVGYVTGKSLDILP